MTEWQQRSHRPPPGTSTRRCHAKRSDGRPCGSYAMYGCLVCAAHGGKAPQVREAAKERTLQAQAAAALKRLQAGERRDPLLAQLYAEAQPEPPPPPCPRRVRRAPPPTPEELAEQQRGLEELAAMTREELAEQRRLFDEALAALREGRLPPEPYRSLFAPAEGGPK